jgi:hypothetical protein
VEASVLRTVAGNVVVLLEPVDCGIGIAECGLEYKKSFQSEIRNPQSARFALTDTQETDKWSKRREEDCQVFSA